MPVLLQYFDGTAVFNKLMALRLERQTKGIVSHKLMPEQEASNLNAALAAYKAGDRDTLTELIGYFIAGDRDDSCAPEKYMVEKYYYPGRVTWSNDLAFLLEQSGYYQEAAVLLEHIIRKHPDRTVAYLNLADAYWSLQQKEQAREAYSLYQTKMTRAGKQDVIPQRVRVRI